MSNSASVGRASYETAVAVIPVIRTAIDGYVVALPGRLMAEAFTGAVLNGKAVLFPPGHAVQNTRLLDAVTRAARSASVEV
jgi:hypothetical protein